MKVALQLLHGYVNVSLGVLAKQWRYCLQGVSNREYYAQDYLIPLLKTASISIVQHRNLHLSLQNMYVLFSVQMK